MAELTCIDRNRQFCSMSCLNKYPGCGYTMLFLYQQLIHKTSFPGKSLEHNKQRNKHVYYLYQNFQHEKIINPFSNYRFVFLQ